MLKSHDQGDVASISKESCSLNEVYGFEGLSFELRRWSTLEACKASLEKEPEPGNDSLASSQFIFRKITRELLVGKFNGFFQSPGSVTFLSVIIGIYRAFFSLLQYTLPYTFDRFPLPPGHFTVSTLSSISLLSAADPWDLFIFPRTAFIFLQHTLTWASFFTPLSH